MNWLKVLYLLPMFSLLITFVLPVKAQNTVISGTNKSYAGEVFRLQGIANYITRQPEMLAIDTVDADGHFSLRFSLSQTRYVYIPVGIFQLSLYVEPNKTYNISIPDFQPMGYAQWLNPYFIPTEVSVGIKDIDTSDVNMLIEDFDRYYTEYIDQNQYDMLKNPRQTDVDTLIEQVEQIFSPFNKPYFISYRHYKYAWLRFVTYMRDNRYITREYFNGFPILYQNVAYLDLFNQIYTNYLSFYSQSKDGARLFSDVAYAKSPKYIYETFANNLVLTDSNFQELVLLKGLHDALSTADFPSKSLLITLDSVAETTANPEHKKIAQSIRQNATLVRSGYPVTPFSLPDTANVIRSNMEFLSNYVYLHFFSVKSFACQTDLQLLKKFNEKHREDIKVVSISIDPDFEEVKAYFRKNNYNWTLLNGNTQPNLTEKYKVSAYPTYYLIDTDGKFAMTPTAKISEKFEYHFFQYLQSKRRSGN